jgi:endo-1,4-beta-xylanase
MGQAAPRSADTGNHPVTSSEPDNGLGDGDTAGDIQGWTAGTDDRTGQLRAERAGGGTGRVYTFTYQATDAAGNRVTAICTVTVPHNRGR